jgi:3-methyladenine DNA glycosylase AlkD
VTAAFDADAASARIVEALIPLGTPERAVQEKRYLKSGLDFLGVTVPDTRRVVVAAVREHPGLDRAEAIGWALALWREPVHERRMAAVEVLRLQVRALRSADLPTVELLIREALSWALVDPLAADIAGKIVLTHPGGWPLIDRWATDEDFWVRRSALLSLLPGIRGGEPDLARFGRYATPLLCEKEFFIRKAIGWVLREISKKDPAFVTTYTKQHLHAMSGVTFREAVRRLPAAQVTHLTATRDPRP